MGIIFLGTLVLGSLLRFYHLTSIPLWHDEAFSALLIRYSWPEMLYRIGLDVHPPLYYIALRFWHTMFGDSLLSLRSFSAVCGIAAILVVYYLVQKSFANRFVTLASTLLVATSAFHIQYVTEARMYTFGGMLLLLAALVIEHISSRLDAAVSGRAFTWKAKVLWYGGFTLLLASLAYTHYYLLFSAAALGVYGLYRQYRVSGWRISQYGWIIGSGIFAGILYLPWLPTFLFQFKQVGAGYWIPPMDRWSIPSTVWTLLTNWPTQPKHYTLAIITIVVVGIIGFVLWRSKAPAKWLVVLSFIAPFAGAILFALLAKLRGESSSVYLIRYFYYTVPFLFILLAVAFSYIPQRLLRVLALVLLVGTNVTSVWYYWNKLDIEHKQGIAAASELLAQNVTPQDKLFVASSFEYFNYQYYHRAAVSPKLYSGGLQHVSQLPHYAGTALLNDSDLAPDFTTATKRGQTVWVLWTTGFGGSKPTVPTNWKQIDEHGYADVRPYDGTWVVVTTYQVQ